VIPVLLGAGVPLFPAGKPRLAKLELVRSRAYSNGIVGLEYVRAKKK